MTFTAKLSMLLSLKYRITFLNFLTETGPIYKDNASIEFYTNEEDKDIKYEYSDILKYESDTSKNDVFKVFDTDTFTMAVQVNIGNITGGTTFNMIEICPYLPGSFNIEEIRLFTVEQYLTQDLVTPALPCETVCAKYDLEYGSAEIEMHKDPSNRVRKLS